MPEWKQLIRERLAGLKLDPRREAEIVEELAQDLEQRYTEALASGVSHSKAQAEALRQLENAEALCAAIRRAERPAPLPESLAGGLLGGSRGNWAADLIHDLRYHLRVLAKSPGFAAVAILTLALGIGANTAIFTVVEAVLLRPLPYGDSERLAVLMQFQEPYGEAPQLAYLDYSDIRQQSPDFENLAAILIDGFTVVRGQDPMPVNGLRVTASFFPTMALRPALGRAFLPEEEAQGRDRVAVISDRFWREQFGSDRAAIGALLKLDGESYQVVGVLPPRFDFTLPLTSSFVIRDVDVYVPLSKANSYAQRRTVFTFEVVGRLKAGASFAQAQTGLNTIAARLAAAHPDSNTGRRFLTKSMHQQVVGDAQPALLVLLCAAGLVLLIACANLGSLLLARATARRKEFSIRAALGASRGRMARQLVTESLLLSTLGGGAGLLLAVWVKTVLVQLPGVPLPRLEEVTVDPPVLLFAGALTLVTALLCSLAPMFSLRGADVQSGLRDAARSTSRGFAFRLRSSLVAGEVAAACVLLIGSTLLLTSLLAVWRAPTGFDAQRVLTLRVALTQQRYESWKQVTATFHELATRIGALPGVEAAALTGSLPLSGHNVGSSLWIGGRETGATHEAPSVRWQYVFPGYFRTMGIPLLRGRDFTAADQERAAHQTIISESLARAHFPGQDPIGKRVYYGPRQEKPDWHEIIGVAGDVRHGSLEEAPVPRAYDLFGQHRGLSMSLLVRTVTDAEAITSAVRHALRELDPEAPAYSVATMETLMERSVAPRKYLSILVGSFAGLAFVLAVVGLHGVLAYSVERRTQEIGVRVALGATRANVMGLVLREGLTLAAVGLAVGLAGSLGLAQLLQGLLYGVGASDVRVYALVATVIVAVAVAACVWPARRALRVDPITALRHE
jgi:putative ABC transport system permease protein